MKQKTKQANFINLFLKIIGGWNLMDNEKMPTLQKIKNKNKQQSINRSQIARESIIRERISLKGSVVDL